MRVFLWSSGVIATSFLMTKDATACHCGPHLLLPLDYSLLYSMSPKSIKWLVKFTPKYFTNVFITQGISKNCSKWDSRCCAHGSQRCGTVLQNWPAGSNPNIPVNTTESFRLIDFWAVPYLVMKVEPLVSLVLYTFFLGQLCMVQHILTELRAQPLACNDRSLFVYEYIRI
jgi:hypothetical protein